MRESLFNQGLNELKVPFSARHYAHLVHVKIEVMESEAGVFLPELAPGTDAYAGCVPSESGFVGRLAEPEVAVAEQLQTLLLVEYGGILAALLAVVTRHTDVGVAVETRRKVVELRLEALLRAEGVGVFKVYLVGNHLAAHRPYVAFLVVAAVVLTDVVSADKQCLRTHRHGKGESHGCGKIAFHDV